MNNNDNFISIKYGNDKIETINMLLFRVVFSRLHSYCIHNKQSELQIW